MAICKFSFSRVCPVKSASRRGRKPASNCASSSFPDAATSLLLLVLPPGISAPAPEPSETTAQTRRGCLRRALFEPPLRPPGVRSQGLTAPTKHLHPAATETDERRPVPRPPEPAA